jgi:N-acyl-D-amino-acid deacylase
MSFTRRHLIATALGFPAILRGAAADTSVIDEAMRGLLAKYGIPGGALGIARAGDIAYARGFGMANRERGTEVTATSKFRLASVSKPITAAAVLRLCEQGKLSLDEAVLPRLALEPLSGSFGDSRWGSITVRHLLQHSGGWDKSRSGDAMFKSPEICKAAGISGPADAKTTVRWMLGRKLDFNPGTRYDYCNFGYCVLGRLIESITGQSYGDAVQKLVLGPCGASGMALGRSLNAVSNEVRYYQDGSAPSVFPQLPSRVSWPYGTFSLEANDANGGWVSNVSDMLRFLSALDEGSSKPLLTRDHLQQIYTSKAPGAGGKDAYYGLGWLVRPNGQQGRPNLWHIGGLPGTKTIAVRLGDGFDWIALFNSRPGGDADGFDRFNAEVQNTIHNAARKVTAWS